MAVSQINLLLKTVGTYISYNHKMWYLLIVVLADCGFDIEDSVAFRGTTLNIPAFI